MKLIALKAIKTGDKEVKLGESFSVKVDEAKTLIDSKAAEPFVPGKKVNKKNTKPSEEV